MKEKIYKFIVFVPQTHVEQVRIAICNAGAGKIGKKYDNCTFMSPGVGTFRPLKGANPHVGKVGQIERVGEARIETVVYKKDLKKVIAAMKKAHPYEEPAFEEWELLEKA